MLVAFLDRCPLLFLEKSMGSIDMDSSFSTWHRQRKGGQSSGCTTKEILRCASCSVLKLLSALLEANLETGSILAHSDNACCFRWKIEMEFIFWSKMFFFKLRSVLDMCVMIVEVLQQSCWGKRSHQHLIFWATEDLFWNQLTGFLCREFQHAMSWSIHPMTCCVPSVFEPHFAGPIQLEMSTSCVSCSKELWESLCKHTRKPNSKGCKVRQTESRWVMF